MISCYKCEKCGMIFEDWDKCNEHEGSHFNVKRWTDSDDDKVIDRETEYIPELYAPSAVVVPMVRRYYDSEKDQYIDETCYIKYYYSAKKCAEQVFPIDESLIK